MLICETSIAPITIPIIEAGIVIKSVFLSYVFRYVQTATISSISKIGINTAAACKGEATIAIRGTANAPIPVSPPFDSPISITEGIAIV